MSTTHTYSNTEAIRRQNTGPENKGPRMDRGHGGSHAYEYLGHLQRAVGNQGVNALWNSGTLQKKLGIQTKMMVGAAEDDLEHKADIQADAVMKMPDAIGQPDKIQPKLQRECADCEEKVDKKEIQRETAIDDDTAYAKRIQRNLAGMDDDASESMGYTHAFERSDKDEDLGNTTSMYFKAEAGGAGPVDAGIESGINSLRSRGGSALPESERSFFEPRFGRDFSNVRIHTGPDAAQISRSINARAFTIGRDVVFGANQYRPGTTAGRHLMAHELAHTTQQESGVRSNLLQRKPSSVKKRTVRFSKLPPAKELDTKKSYVRVMGKTGYSSKSKISLNGQLYRAAVQAREGDLVTAVVFDIQGKVYGSSTKVSASEDVFLEFDEEHVEERGQTPSGVQFVRGSGSGVTNEADMRAFLTQPGHMTSATQYRSLGQNGRVILTFDPPLRYKPGFTSLKVLDFASYEGMRVLLSNNAPEFADPDPGPAGPMISGGLYVDRNRRPANFTVSETFTMESGSRFPTQSFKYVQITDLNTPQQPHPSTPGLDISGVRGNVVRTVDRVTVLLDMSGSMSDNLKRQKESKRKTAAHGSRLYQLAADAARKNLIPVNPVYSTRYTANGFFVETKSNAKTGKSEYTAKITGHSGSAAHARDTMQDFAKKTKDFGFKDYTPLATTLETAATNVRNSPAAELVHLVVVITDGEGSASFGEDLSQFARPSNPPDLRIHGKKAALELVGFKVKAPEHLNFLKFRPPGGASDWSVNAYDATSVADLSQILGGIKAKYGLQDLS